jgi:hypothetical protein
VPNEERAQPGEDDSINPSASNDSSSNAGIACYENHNIVSLPGQNRAFGGYVFINHEQTIPDMNSLQFQYQHISNTNTTHHS